MKEIKSVDRFGAFVARRVNMYQPKNLYSNPDSE